MSDSTKQQQSPRGRGNPQPLRVNQGGSGLHSSRGTHSSQGNRGHRPHGNSGGADQQQVSDNDFIYPQPPGSAHSARPGTQGGHSQRSQRTQGGGARFTPRKEQTVVGVGTHGLGDRGKEIHETMRSAVYVEWCKVKDEERAQAHSPEVIKAQQEARAPLSPAERKGDRQNKIAVRKQYKDYHDEIKAEEFRKEKLAVEEDHQRERKEVQAFVSTYSEDNVKECREQIKKRQQHVKELQSYSLPSLAPMRKELREEKARWAQQQLEEDSKWEQEKSARREYILEMKRIAAINRKEAMSGKRAIVEKDKAELERIETQRKKEAADLEALRKIDAKEEKEKLKAEIRKAKFKNWEAMDKMVTLRKEEAEALSVPILEDRELHLTEKKGVVKERYDSQRTPRGQDFFEGSRKQFFVDRKAAANDIRSEKRRNRENVKKEKEEVKVHKLQQHEEGFKASHVRLEKQRSRPGSRSPDRSPRGGEQQYHQHSPREAW